MIPILGRLTETGACVAVIIPRAALEELGWRRREPVAVSVENGFFVVSSIRKAIDDHQRRAADAVAARQTSL